MHVLPKMKEKKQRYCENHLELGLQVVSLHLRMWFCFVGVFCFFFINIIKKKKKFPPCMAAEPTETHFVTGHQCSSLHRLMQLSVPFSELYIDLSSANAAEAKGNYKGLQFVCLYGTAFGNHSRPKRPDGNMCVSCTNRQHLSTEIEIWVLRGIFVQRGKLRPWDQKIGEKFYSQTHRTAYPDSTTLFLGSETSFIQQTLSEGLLPGTTLSDRKTTVNKTDKNPSPYKFPCNLHSSWEKRGK